jgi:hypothetical protein
MRIISAPASGRILRSRRAIFVHGVIRFRRTERSDTTDTARF